METTRLENRKAELVLRTFVAAGDEDYFSARWGSLAGLPSTFLFHYQQLVEKYLKAVLLLNDRKISRAHDIEKLEREVRVLFADSFEAEIASSRHLFGQDRVEIKTSLSQEIAFLQEYGTVNVRYNTCNRLLDGFQLNILDEVVFLLRSILRRSAAKFSIEERSFPSETNLTETETECWALAEFLPLEQSIDRTNQSILNKRELTVSQATLSTKNERFFNGKSHCFFDNGFTYLGSPILAAGTITSRALRDSMPIDRSFSVQEDRELFDWALDALALSEKEKAKLKSELFCIEQSAGLSS